MTPPRIDIPPRDDARRNARRSRASSLAGSAGASQHKLASFFGEVPPPNASQPRPRSKAGAAAAAIASPPPQLDLSLNCSPIRFPEMDSALPECSHSSGKRRSNAPSSLEHQQTCLSSMSNVSSFAGLSSSSSSTWASTDRSASITLTPVTSPRLSILTSRFSLRPTSQGSHAAPEAKMRVSTSSKDTTSTDTVSRSSASLEGHERPSSGVSLAQLATARRTKALECSCPAYACEYWMLSRTTIIDAALGRWGLLKGITLHKRGWRTRQVVLASNAKPNEEMVSSSTPIVFDFDVEACGGAAAFASLHSFKEGKGGARVELQRLVLSPRSFVAVADSAQRYGSGRWVLVIGGAEASYPQVQAGSRTGHTEDWLLQLESVDQLQLWQTTIRALVSALRRADDVFRSGKRSTVLLSPASKASSPSPGLGILLGGRRSSVRRSVPTPGPKATRSAAATPTASVADDDADLAFSVNQTAAPSSSMLVAQPPRNHALERVEALEVPRPGSSTDPLLKEEVIEDEVAESSLSKKMSGLFRSSSMKQLHSVTAHTWASTSTDTVNSEPAFHPPLTSYLSMVSLKSPTKTADEEDRESLYSEPEQAWSPSHRDSTASFMRVRSRSNSTSSEGSHFSLSRGDLPPRAPAPRTAPPPVPSAALSPAIASDATRNAKSSRSSIISSPRASAHPFSHSAIVSPSSSPRMTLADAITGSNAWPGSLNPASPASSYGTGRREPPSPASTLSPSTPADAGDFGRFVDAALSPTAQSAEDEPGKIVNKERKQALLAALSLEPPSHARITEPAPSTTSTRDPEPDVPSSTASEEKVLRSPYSDARELGLSSPFSEAASYASESDDGDSDEAFALKVTSMDDAVEIVRAARVQERDGAGLIFAHRHSQSADQLQRLNADARKYAHATSPSLPSSFEPASHRFTFTATPWTKPSSGRGVLPYSSPSSTNTSFHIKPHADSPVAHLTSFAQHQLPPSTPLTSENLLRHFPSPPKTLPMACRSRKNSAASEGACLSFTARGGRKANVGFAL